MKIRNILNTLNSNRAVLLFFALLLASRLLLFLIARPHWQDLITPDTKQHLEVAYGLDRHGQFAYSYSNKLFDSLDCSLRVGPLYPVFLAVILKTGNFLQKEPAAGSVKESAGEARLKIWELQVREIRKTGFRTVHYDLLITCHILFALLTGLLIFRLAAKYLGRRAAMAALLFYALDPPSNIFTVYATTENIFVVIFTASFVVLLLSFQKEDQKGVLYAVLSGLLSGLAALCRSIALYFFAVVFAIFLVYGKGRQWKWLLKRYLFWNLGFLPLILLWVLRNFLVVGMPVFETISCRNFLMYRASGVMCEVNGLSLEKNELLLYAELEKRIGNANLNPAQYAAGEKQLGLEILRKYPWATVKTTFLSFIRLMLSPGRSEMGQVLGYYPTMLVQHNEVLHFYRYLNFKNLKVSFSNLKESLVWVVIMSWTYLAALYACSAAGIYALWKRDRELTLALLFVFLYFAVLSSGPESVSRFRVPFMPFLSIFAGTGAVFIFKRKIEPDTR
jgi:4-amino-4-deoxy-L-arabinose transferase-like glycosyltransferase